MYVQQYTVIIATVLMIEKIQENKTEMDLTISLNVEGNCLVK